MKYEMCKLVRYIGIVEDSFVYFNDKVEIRIKNMLIKIGIKFLFFEIFGIFF